MTEPTYTFDFYTISNLTDFYKIFVRETKATPDFGNNLDALYDTLTGSLTLPAAFTFINLSLPQLEQFDTLIETMEDAAFDTDGELSFTYSIRPQG